jgi:hypothetical protein
VIEGEVNRRHFEGKKGGSGGGRRGEKGGERSKKGRGNTFNRIKETQFKSELEGVVEGETF